MKSAWSSEAWQRTKKKMTGGTDLGTLTWFMDLDHKSPGAKHGADNLINADPDGSGHMVVRDENPKGVEGYGSGTPQGGSVGQGFSSVSFR